MFNDTIELNDLALNPVTFTRRSPRGNRSVFVPSGDTPSDERRIEIGHEVTSAKRVNSLVKFATIAPNPITNVLEEGSVQVKIVHPASFTATQVAELVHSAVVFAADGARVTKIFNQEA